jgi:hypothetical protein
VSDYISKSALIEALKQEIRLITPIEENHDMFYHDSGYNCAMVGARLLAEKLPTLDETEIIRKEFERVMERLEGLRAKPTETVYDTVLVGSIIGILKEECGINE